MKWAVNFNAGKTHLVLFDQFNNTVAIDVKLDGSVIKEKSSFNHNMPGKRGGQIDRPCGFPKNISSKERGKPFVQKI